MHKDNQNFQKLVRETEKRLKMSKRKDYYKILDIHRTADTADIKKAYRSAAKKHHPDRATGDKKKAEEKFREVAEAYEVCFKTTWCILHSCQIVVYAFCLN